MTQILTAEFRALSARLGQDPLQVQGAGGNTSIKSDGVLWVKASGTELADAERKDIFVAVDRAAACAEIDGAGDGSCKTTVLDPTIKLRPSIETTFHAALNHPVVAHTHSVATLVHAISPEGRIALQDKLQGLPHAIVPFAKPGLSLTKEILKAITPDTKIIILNNHGLICCGASVAEVSDLIATVEDRLSMPPRRMNHPKPDRPPEPGYRWADEGWIAVDQRISELARTGSYYPDHVVFLGPALPTKHHDGNPPAILHQGQGIALKEDATPSQQAMLRCLADILIRLPEEWTAEPIGPDAEAALLNWDAEKYRQALAASAS